VRDRREQLAAARLYLVCGEEDDAFLGAALRGGVDIVQLRMKTSDDAAIVRAGRRFRRITAAHDALLIVNDRPDLAAEIGADGAHLGQDDMAIADARPILGADRLLGLSTHSAPQIDSAAAAGVDYIGVGPVNETPTKPGRAAVGLELVRYAARRARVPFFAIGGISASNLVPVRDAGARRIAVVRALTEASDPDAVARTLRQLLDTPREARVGAA
jgi:thiamine-phosphate pyrophosphorylase